jgi:DDE superfamily endonuclease
LSQDEARFPLVPTLCRTLGVKGHRPQVGTWDNKDWVYWFAAVHVVSGQRTTRLVEQAKRRKGASRPSKTACLQRAFATHLRDIARAYPAARYPEVIVTIDNAPWHRGAAVTEVLAAHPHLRLYRLPSYSPQLNVIERFWRKLRRRATHNRLFETMAALRQTLRQNLCYFQTMRHQVLSLLEGPRKKKQI